MNMAGVKIREAEIDQVGPFCLTTRIEDWKAMVVCHYSEDIIHIDRLKYNEFSGCLDQLARVVTTSNLANEGNCPFAATSGSQIMDIKMSNGAKT
jgi:hypothetical protein